MTTAQTTAMPVKKPPPPPPQGPAGRNGPPVAAMTPCADFQLSSGVVKAAQKIVIYGPGGIGKSSLASLIAQCEVRPQFLDIGEGTHFLNVNRVENLTTWEDLRAALHSESLWLNYNVVVLHDLTKAE